MREYEYFLTLLVTAAVTYLLTPLVRKTAIRVGAVPATRERDVHKVPIPRMGGIAMYFGVAAGLLAATEIVPFRDVIRGTGLVNGLLLAGGLIVIIGVIDDRWGISAIGKLAGQVAAAGVLVASGAQLSSFPLPKGNVFGLTQNEGVVLTILLVVATINAVNFIDGLDGLAAGIVCIAAISFFIYYYSLTKVAAGPYALPAEAVPALASVVLAGACIGFLPHNFHPARIFMGDTGAMLLGLLLAYVPISAISTLDFPSLADRANRYAEILPLLLPAAVMVIPYTDMLRAVVRRTRAGLSPFAADNKHLHHRMLEIGHSHRSSVLILYAWAALFAGTVVGLSIATAPLIELAGTTLAAVLVLVLLSIPRLRWWERGKSDSPRRALPADQVTPAPATPAQAQAPSAQATSVRAPSAQAFSAAPLPSRTSAAPLPSRTSTEPESEHISPATRADTENADSATPTSRPSPSSPSIPPGSSSPSSRSSPSIPPGSSSPHGPGDLGHPGAADRPDDAFSQVVVPGLASGTADRASGHASGTPVDATAPTPIPRASGSVIP